jgi:hypothetical protein
MNKKYASREAAKARRGDKIGCHTRAGTYPGSQQAFIHKPVGPFDKCHSANSFGVGELLRGRVPNFYFDQELRRDPAKHARPR